MAPLLRDAAEAIRHAGGGSVRALPGAGTVHAYLADGPGYHAAAAWLAGRARAAGGTALALAIGSPPIGNPSEDAR
jgi:hypothetical protein